MRIMLRNARATDSTGTGPRRWGSRAMAMSSESKGSDLWRMSACDAVDMLQSGKVSPLELIDAALARIAAVNPKVNALVTIGEERARNQAQRLMDRPLEARGLLKGLPIAVKDLNDVAGLRTTYGSPIFADN